MNRFLTSLLTPRVLVDVARFERNLTRMQRMAAEGGKTLRPHAKTHKSPTLARRQVEAGAVGICCAKLGEAEVFAGSGVKDIRVAYPLDPSNVRRVLALMERVRLSFIVDHPDVARAWSDAMATQGARADVLVKVDVGLHRCGVDPESPSALALVRQVASSSGLRLHGLLAHAGHAYLARSAAEIEQIARAERDVLNGLATSAECEGIRIEEVSVGATPTARFSCGLDGISELRPGNYVYNDRTQVALEAATVADCALTVLARVVSKPAANRIILDCGSKTLSSDVARGFTEQSGFGVVLRDLEGDDIDGDLVMERLSEEHATVRVASGLTRLAPGDLVRIIPNHSCVVVNLVDEIWLVDGLRLVQTLPVAARGQIA